MGANRNFDDYCSLIFSALIFATKKKRDRDGPESWARQSRRKVVSWERQRGTRLWSGAGEGRDAVAGDGGSGGGDGGTDEQRAGTDDSDLIGGGVKDPPDTYGGPDAAAAGRKCGAHMEPRKKATCGHIDTGRYHGETGKDEQENGAGLLVGGSGEEGEEEEDVVSCAGDQNTGSGCMPKSVAVLLVAGATDRGLCKARLRLLGIRLDVEMQGQGAFPFEQNDDAFFE
ncbi:hypothetical protein HK104_001290 [Borealophlyctis nickersoniae]|nr:hypothetical protein HK104_001290 [Borealophlyctis nickersoniae]